MRSPGKKTQKPMEACSEGEPQDIGEAVRNFELDSPDHRISDVEREAIRQRIDAAKVGSFAPEEEMDEFYRLHRGA